MSTAIIEADVKSRNEIIEPDGNTSGLPQNSEVFDIEADQQSNDKSKDLEEGASSFCIQPYITRRGAVYLG